MYSIVHDMTNTDVSRQSLATYSSRRPWLRAVLLGLVPVVLTSFGFGYAQSRHLDDRHTYLVTAAAVSLAAGLGLILMLRSSHSLAAHGFRSLEAGSFRRVLWLVPVALGPVLIVATTGVAVDRALIPGFLWLAAAAALSEEVWYRGLIMAVLRPLGERPAIVGSAAIFGVLHLANLLGGVSPLYAVLQLLFAGLFGLIAALLVSHTGSLWPAIAWHFAHDAVTYVGGDALTARTLGVLAIECAVLTAYAVLLWRRLPEAGFPRAA